jgi:hypothetical protein
MNKTPLIDVSDIHCNVTLLRGIPANYFQTVSGSGTIVSRSILTAKVDASAQESNFAFTGPFWELNCRTSYFCWEKLDNTRRSGDEHERK